MRLLVIAVPVVVGLILVSMAVGGSYDENSRRADRADSYSMQTIQTILISSFPLLFALPDLYTSFMFIYCLFWDLKMRTCMAVAPLSDWPYTH